MGFMKKNTNTDHPTARSSGSGVLNKIYAGGMVVLIIAVAALLIQNSMMIKQMDKVLGESEGKIHELYDDTAVINAFKSESTEDDKNLNAEDAFILDKAREVLKEVIKDDMSDYEKEKAIYEWQINWVNYQDENLSPVNGGQDKSHLPYGVLKYHQAICVGNATTFKLFMDMLDIPCQIIHSTVNGEHAWNLVKLEDDWYHVDITFDSGTGGNIEYTYFNVPDSIKDDGSYPWDHAEIPAAEGTKYCYMFRNAVTLDNFYAIPKELKKAADKGKSTASFILKDTNGFTQDVANYISDNLYVGTGTVYFGDSYAVGGKVIYVYNFRDQEEDTFDNENTETFEKLDRILQKLNNGKTPTVSDEYEEDISAFSENEAHSL